jgi:hypothetical protein
MDTNDSPTADGDSTPPLRAFAFGRIVNPTSMLSELDTKVNKLGIKGVDGYGEWPSSCGERSWSPAPARRFPLA